MGKRKAGFTIIEILVVVAVIAMIAALIIASLNGAREKARISKARGDISSIVKAINILEGDAGEWPGHTTSDDLGVSGADVFDLSQPGAGLVESDGTYQRWSGPYIPAVGVDPWGNNYFFTTNYDIDASTIGAVVGSFGPDGIQNTPDDIYEVLVAQ